MELPEAETPETEGSLPPSRHRDELRDILSLALNGGQLMLENGASTARVEETVLAMAVGLGADSVDVFATPTGIIASAHAQGEHRTKLVRILDTTLLLGRVSDVLDLSRRVVKHKLSRDELRRGLAEIATKPRIYGHWMVTLAVVMGCCTFAALIGAGWYEVGICALASAIAQQLRVLLFRMRINRLLNTGLVAAVASGIALLGTMQQGTLPNASAVISSVLFLAPGVVMMSAVLDLFGGDMVAGVSRAASAMMTLVAIAVGMWAVLLLGGITALPSAVVAPPLLLSLGLAFLETIAFAIVFDAPRRSLLPGGVIGIAMYALHQSLLIYNAPMEVAMFGAGLIVGILGELCARIFRLPATIFTIPGFIAVVPGVLAFRTVLAFVMNDYSLGLTSLVQAFLYTGALAAGLGTVELMVRTWQKPLIHPTA